MIRVIACPAAISSLADHDTIPRAMGTSVEAELGSCCLNAHAEDELQLQESHGFATPEMRPHFRLPASYPGQKKF